MKIYNSYIIMMALLLLLTTIILMVTGQTSLDAYYLTYIIEALIVTELYVYFNTKARRGLHIVSVALLGGFLFIVSLEVIKMLA